MWKIKDTEIQHAKSPCLPTKAKISNKFSLPKFKELFKNNLGAVLTSVTSPPSLSSLSSTTSTTPNYSFFMTDDIYGHLSSRLANMPKIAKGYTQDCFGKPYKSRTAILEIKRTIRNFLVTSKFPNRILIIPGLRGVGKTTLLFQIYNHIVSEERVPSERVLNISMEQAATVNAAIQNIVTAYEERVLGRRIESVEDKIFLHLLYTLPLDSPSLKHEAYDTPYCRGALGAAISVSGKVGV